MKKRRLILLISITLIQAVPTLAQDTTYARQIINKLTSKDFFGRGYVNKGVNKASDYLVKQYKQIGLDPFTKKFIQPFTLSVNAFPAAMNVAIDNKQLIPGVHYIISPESKGIAGGYNLFKLDSTTYGTTDLRRRTPLNISLKKKLTYSVSTQVSDVTTIELLKDSFPKLLENIQVKIDNKYISNYSTNNIVGYIKGNSQPDSFVVFTAHYDHLGGMGSTTYFPGANDNASGVSILLNLAKYYKKNPPNYSIAFILFSAEEAGLIGSKYYVEHPLFPLSNIKFLINLDLLGTGDEGITVVNATEFKHQYETLKQINDTKKYLTHLKPRGKAQNSDHYWFSEKGVPCFFIYTMGGIKAYHDVYDISKTLPLTKYKEVFNLLVDFTNEL